MANENVEIARRFGKCWERSDWDGMVELVDPNVEQHGTVGGLEYQRGRSSGLEVDLDAAVVVDLQDGRIIRIQGFMDRAAALEAVGLPAQDAHNG